MWSARCICSAALLFGVSPHQTVSKINCTFMYPLQSCSVILPNRQVYVCVLTELIYFSVPKLNEGTTPIVSMLAYFHTPGCLTSSMRSNKMDTKYIIQSTLYTTGGIYMYVDPKHVTHRSKSSYTYLKQTQLPYSAWPFQTQYKLIH